MAEFLSEDFLERYNTIIQNEFERFVAQTGDYIINAVQPAVNAGKKSAKGKFFIGADQLGNKPTFTWQIAEEFIPIVWQVFSADINADPHELTVQDLFVIEDDKGKRAWFAMRNAYNGATTPSFTRFCFALTDYLAPHGITVTAKKVSSSVHHIQIAYAYKKA